MVHVSSMMRQLLYESLAERFNVITEDEHMLEVNRITRGIGQQWTRVASDMVVLRGSLLFDTIRVKVSPNNNTLDLTSNFTLRDVWLGDVRGDCDSNKSMDSSPGVEVDVKNNDVYEFSANIFFTRGFSNDSDSSQPLFLLSTSVREKILTPLNKPHLLRSQNHRKKNAALIIKATEPAEPVELMTSTKKKPNVQVSRHEARVSFNKKNC